MTQERLLSWIFYSVAMAMDLDHAGYDEISIIADSMSTAPPSRREMKDSVEWLVKNNLVEGRKDFRLTETGKWIYACATRETKLIPEVWNNLERLIDERLKDYAPPAQE